MTSDNDRVWLITGGSRGIGLAVAHRALNRGDRVVIVSRSQFEDHAVAENADRCLCLQADVGNKDQLKELLDRVNTQWGRVDVVVNNAGLHRGGRLSKLAESDWQDVLNTNLTGAMNVIKACHPLLGERASIINVGAVVGFRGFPGDSAYAASKAGISGLTRALAIEYAKKGITVNLVIPGLVLTEMTSGLTEKSLKSMCAMVPMQRYGEADEIAEVIEWVSASRYMTGAFVPVDGGLMSTFGLPG